MGAFSEAEMMSWANFDADDIMDFLDEEGQLDFRTVIFVMIHLSQVQKDRLGHTPSRDKPKLV